MSRLRLGVNVDHVATLRQARGGFDPDPVRAALIAQDAGADGITAHLREDRRHIGDNDVARLRQLLRIPLNLEMAATEEMVAIATHLRPHACCIVPEKREERTTEGGIQVVDRIDMLQPLVRRLLDAGVRVSMFIEPDPAQIQACKSLGAPVVELHTGAYANASGEARKSLLHKIQSAAAYGACAGLEIHAGHGLNYENVKPIAAIAEICELNIGHFLVGEALFLGLKAAITTMRELMDEPGR